MHRRIDYISHGQRLPSHNSFTLQRFFWFVCFFDAQLHKKNVISDPFSWVAYHRCIMQALCKVLKFVLLKLLSWCKKKNPDCTIREELNIRLFHGRTNSNRNKIMICNGQTSCCAMLHSRCFQQGNVLRQSGFGCLHLKVVQISEDRL